MSALIIHKVALVIVFSIAAAVFLPPSGGTPT